MRPTPCAQVDAIARRPDREHLQVGRRACRGISRRRPARRSDERRDGAPDPSRGGSSPGPRSPKSSCVRSPKRARRSAPRAFRRCTRARLGVAYVSASSFVWVSRRLEAQARVHRERRVLGIAWVLFRPPAKKEDRPSPVLDRPGEGATFAESDRRLHGRIPKNAAWRSELPPRCEKRPTSPTQCALLRDGQVALRHARGLGSARRGRHARPTVWGGRVQGALALRRPRG